MYRDSRYKDNMVTKPPYLYNGFAYTGKTPSLYRDNPRGGGGGGGWKIAYPSEILISNLKVPFVFNIVIKIS